MTHRAAGVLIVSLNGGLCGCLVNGVHQIHSRTPLEPGHAIVVVGLGLNSPRAYPYSVSLDEYSLKNNQITGNCFHYNHIEASVPSGQKDVKYLAFVVPAGVYVFSGFNAAPAAHPLPRPAAFSAPSGGVVYFGNYIAMEDGSVELRSNLDAASSAVAGVIPKLSTLSQAEPEPTVQHGSVFLCTP